MKYFISFVLSITLINIVKTEFIYSCTEKKTIALTFDDGPHEHTRNLVDYMRKQQDVKVTFFTVAEFHYPFAVETKEFQEAMKLAHDSGFQIASHTYFHKIPSEESEFKKTLTDNDDFIESVTGDRPRYFRAPKGECTDEQQKNLDKWGYRLIQWDTDTNDWDIESSGSEEKRVEDSINFLKQEFAKEKDNYLILMHDSQSYTVNKIAPWIIEKSGMKEKGYRFVTVAECLGDKNGMYSSGKTYDSPSKPSSTSNNDTPAKPSSTSNNDTPVFNNDTTVDDNTSPAKPSSTSNNDTPVFNNDTTVDDNTSNKNESNLVTDENNKQNLENLDDSSDAQRIKYTFIYTLISLLFMIFYFF